MSDAAHSPRRAVRRAPKRQDWLPNRMFDPANNPFAIQNLLAREREKEGAVFQLDEDGRSDAAYAGHPLLTEKEILPPKDFAANRLLNETARFDDAFHAEFDDLEQTEVDERDDPDGDTHHDPLVAGGSDRADSPSAEVRAEPTSELTSPPSPDEPAVAQAASGLADAPTDKETSGASDASDHAVGLQAQADGEIPRTDLTLAGSAATLAAEAGLIVPPTEAPASAAAAATDGERTADASETTTAQTDTGAVLTDASAPLAEPASAGAAHTGDVAAPQQSASATPSPETHLPAPEAENTLAASVQDAEIPAAFDAEGDAVASDHVSPAGAQHVSYAGAGTDDASAGDTTAETSVPVDPAVNTPTEPPGLSNESIDRLLQAAREEAREQGRQEAREAAYQEGFEAGREQARAELQTRFDDKQSQLHQLLESLQRLSEDPDSLFEPMKKLAVHLAEQLVRGELTQSPQIIARLVDNCLRELAASGEKAVIVHLNPEDLEHYKPLVAPLGDSIVLRPDATLARGSVRASLDGSMVEDLMDRRVKGIQQSLSQPVAGGWRPALSNTLAQRAQPQPDRAPVRSEAAEEVTEATDDWPSADDDHAEWPLEAVSADIPEPSDAAVDGEHGDTGAGTTP